jgi:hypothetical protein
VAAAYAEDAEGVRDRAAPGSAGTTEPREPAPEEPLAARVTAYLERHRGNPGRRRITHIAAAIRGDKDKIRACLRERAEYVNEGTEAVQCWALAAWRNGREGRP